jgi:hypothetical protein
VRIAAGQVWRSVMKPECISALTERACARNSGSAGQARPPSCSFRYSTIASESQMRASPSISTGTRRADEYFTICSKNSGVSSGSLISRNGTP